MYEISSDSDDEWYDRCPKKLEKLRNKYGIINVIKGNSEDQEVEENDVSLLNCRDSDVIEVLDESSTNIVSNELYTPASGLRRSKRKNADTQLSPETFLWAEGAKRGRSRGRGRGSQLSSPAAPKSRGRGRGKGRQSSTLSAPKSRGRGKGSQMSIPSAPKSRGRGKGSQLSIPSAPKSRGRGTRSWSTLDDADYDMNTDIISSLPLEMPYRGRKRGTGQKRSSKRITQNSPQIPTFSVGNTHEYPDASDDQVLFSDKKVTSEPSSVIDLDEELNNEELSVKVLWQHSDVVKFNIRRHQKLIQIFDFFVNEKGVSRDRLLFTYNYGIRDRILRPDDTPDSIEYNIAKFIEGGIVNRQISLIKSAGPQKKGFIIKFQCQNKKKPLELPVGKDEKLQLAMVKCAEHLEVPVSSLVFEFDGETIPGTTTPNALDMESGDCIDVKIINVNK